MNRLTYYASIVTLISNILLLASCSTLPKFSDCKKYEKSLSKAANVTLEKTPTPPKTKQDYVAFWSALADMQEKMGTIVTEIDFQDSQSQELQKRFVATNQSFVRVFREKAQTIANLAKEPDKNDIETINRQFKDKISEAHGNWMAVGDEWFKYCFE